MGSRPALLREVQFYNNYQRQRLLVKPGITCYWQTRRNRDSITFDEWAGLDLWQYKVGSWLDCSGYEVADDAKQKHKI